MSHSSSAYAIEPIKFGQELLLSRGKLENSHNTLFRFLMISYFASFIICIFIRSFPLAIVNTPSYTLYYFESTLEKLHYL